MAGVAKKEPRKKFTLRSLKHKLVDKKVRRRRRRQSYSSYILKVLRQIHPDLRVSKMAMCIINCFLDDMFEKIAGEAGRLATIKKRKTISSQEIQTSTKLLLNGELASHAVCEGSKAVKRYINSKNQAT